MGCYLSASVEWLWVSRFIQAFGASTGSVVTQTILRETVDGAKRHAVFAQISAVLAFTPAIGPLIGGWVDQSLGGFLHAGNIERSRIDLHLDFPARDQSAGRLED
ncbi:MFS transporter [Paenibacillus sp. AK002]